MEQAEQERGITSLRPHHAQWRGHRIKSSTRRSSRLHRRGQRSARVDGAHHLVRLSRRSRAPVRDRVAPGRQVPGPADRLHQQVDRVAPLSTAGLQTMTTASEPNRFPSAAIGQLRPLRGSSTSRQQGDRIQGGGRLGNREEVTDIRTSMVGSRSRAEHLTEEVSTTKTSCSSGSRGDGDLEPASRGIAKPRSRSSFTPVLAGSRSRTRASSRCHAVIEYLPSPIEVRPSRESSGQGEDEGAHREPRTTEETRSGARFQDHGQTPTSASGRLSVYSGKLEAGSRILKETGRTERVGRI